MWVGSMRSLICISASEELGTMARTILSQVMSPTPSTTTRSRRPLKSSSRSPPATAGPQTCMTWRSMTTPSAERSLHHCSLRSEKIQRAVHKLMTLLKKACCQVSRCLSVMLEQGDLSPMSLDHWFQTSEKTHVATQNMSKSGFFWIHKKGRLSLIFEQRFKNTSFRPFMTEEVFKNWMKLSSLHEVKFIVLIRRRTTSTRSTISFMNNYWNKIENFVKLMRKVSKRWKNSRDFKALHSIQIQGEDWSKIKTLSLNS